MCTVDTNLQILQAECGCEQTRCGAGYSLAKLQFPFVMVSEARTIPRGAGEARASRTIPRMHPSRMPRQGILPRLFPVCQCDSKTIRCRGKCFQENSLLQHGQHYILGMLRLALIPASCPSSRNSGAIWGTQFAGTRASLSMTGLNFFVQTVTRPHRTVAPRWPPRESRRQRTTCRQSS